VTVLAFGIALIALFPLIYFLISRSQSNNTIPFLVLLGIILIIFFLYFNDSTAKSSFAEHALLININNEIAENNPISPISITNAINNLSLDKKAIFINQLFNASLDKNSLEAAASILAFANSILQIGDYQSLLLLMYADLRDKQYPELLDRAIIINTEKQECAISSLSAAAYLTNGPKIPISENTSNSNQISLSQNTFVVRGFDLMSATLNNESIEVALDLNCESEAFYSLKELTASDLIKQDVYLEIADNAWLKREQ